MLSSNPNLVKQLRLRELDNDALFTAYLNEQKLRQLSPVYIADTKEFLTKFKKHLDGNPPLPEAAKDFLIQYIDRKQSTFLRYYNLVQGFMRWYGTPLDFKPKSPKLTPPYYSNGQVGKLAEAAKNKKTHKKLAVRDSLLIELTSKTGLRRSELASLKVKDVQNGRLQVKGKGGKIRTIPLESTPVLLNNLEKYCKNRDPNESLFGLTAESISNKIRMLSKKAGIEIHTHSLRHYFGTKLVEKGANIRAVQELMGHACLGTTEVYIGVTAKHLGEAMSLMEA